MADEAKELVQVFHVPADAGFMALGLAEQDFPVGMPWPGAKSGPIDNTRLSMAPVLVGEVHPGLWEVRVPYRLADTAASKEGGFGNL